MRKSIFLPLFILLLIPMIFLGVGCNEKPNNIDNDTPSDNNEAEDSVYYEVFFVSLEGTPRGQKINILEGHTIGDYWPTINNPGRKFLGWFDKDGVEVTSSTPITKDLYLKAQWTDFQFNISIDDPDDVYGLGTKNFVIDYGESFSTSSVRELPTPSRKGYRFAGYKTTSGAVFDNATQVYKNEVLYPQWDAIDYIISFNQNAPTGKTVSGTMPTLRYTYDDNNWILASNRYSCAGYTFAGWRYANETGITFTVSNESNIRDKKDYFDSTNITLNAVWEEINYSISYNKNPPYAGAVVNGKMNTQQYGANDSEWKLAKNTFSCEGYNFVRWSYTSTSGTILSFNDEANILSDKDKFDSTNITLNAVWKAIVYTISFDPNAPSEATVTGSMAQQTFTYNDSSWILSANLFGCEGYNFMGWKLRDTDSVYSPGEDVRGVFQTTTVTLLAVWGADINNCYAVSFYPGGAGYIVNNGVTMNRAAKLVLYVTKDTSIASGGQMQTTLPTATRVGFTFGGWRLGSTDGEEFSENTVITSDVTIWVNWIANTYYVQFDANGGDGIMDNQTFHYSSTNTTKKLSKNIFTREYFTFVSWNTSSDGTGTEYADQANVVNLTGENEGIVILYAQWEFAVYTISFDSNAPSGATVTGDMLPQTFTYNDSRWILSANLFSCEGYNFAGWSFTDSTGFDYTFVDGADVKGKINTISTALKAIWNPIIYNIGFNKNAPTGQTVYGVMLAQQFNYSSGDWILNENLYTCEGYTFAGWSFVDSKGVRHTCSDRSNVKGVLDNVNTTLYAIWNVITYTITFDKNNPSGKTVSGIINDISFTYQNSVWNLPTTTYSCEGYTFSGWAYVVGDKTSVYNAGDDVKGVFETNFITLQAVWTPLNCNIVSFYPGGAGYIVNNGVTMNRAAKFLISVVDGLTIATGGQGQNNLPTAIRVGFTFGGWRLGSSTGEVFSENTIITSDVMIWVNWIANTYYVRFDANGGEGTMNDQSFTYSSTNTTRKLSANTFTREYYTFAYWNTNSNGTGEIYQNRADVVNLASGEGDIVTLYAQWIPTVYTVVFNSNPPTGATVTGEMQNQEFTYRSLEWILQPNSFSCEEFEFVCWQYSLGGQTYTYEDGDDISEAFDEEITTVELYAVWESSTNTEDDDTIYELIVLDNDTTATDPEIYNYDVENLFDFDENNIVLSFGAISDVHTSKTTPTNKDQFTNSIQQLLNKAKEKDVDGLDGLVIAGDFITNNTRSLKDQDISDRRAKEEMVEFTDVIKSFSNSALGTNIILTPGNHDTRSEFSLLPSIYSDYDDGTPSLGRDYLNDTTKLQFIEFNLEKGYIHCVLNGYHFFVVQPISYGGAPSCPIDEEVLGWLDRDLSTVTTNDPNKYVFVVTHPTLAYTVHGSYDDYEPGSNRWHNKNLTPILSKYPQVITFSGHTHSATQDERCIMQTDFTSLNCGGTSSNSVGEVDKFTSLQGSVPAGNLSSGLLVQVDVNGNIRITRMNFRKGTTIKSAWVLDSPKSDGSHLTRYSQARSEDNLAPQLNTTITITQDQDNPFMVTFSFDAGTDDDYIKYYDVEITNNDSGATQNIWLISDYYEFSHPKGNMRKTITHSVMCGSGNNTISITAVDTWGTKSNIITKDFDLDCGEFDFNLEDETISTPYANIEFNDDTIVDSEGHLSFTLEGSGVSVGTEVVNVDGVDKTLDALKITSKTQAVYAKFDDYSKKADIENGFFNTPNGFTIETVFQNKKISSGNQGICSSVQGTGWGVWQKAGIARFAVYLDSSTKIAVRDSEALPTDRPVHLVASYLYDSDKNLSYIAMYIDGRCVGVACGFGKMVASKYTKTSTAFCLGADISYSSGELANGYPMSNFRLYEFKIYTQAFTTTMANSVYNSWLNS